MTATSSPPRFGRTPHLVDLVAETERLAELVRSAPSARRAALGTRLADDAALATLRLDGSPIERIPDLEAAPVEERAPAARDRRGTWLDALGALEELPDERLQSLEVLGVRAGLGSDDLAERLLLEPVPALTELHRRLTHGLLAPERAGQPRTTDQAVHDASIGRVLYFASEPDAIPRELGLLGAWLASTGSREHGLVVSGVLHLELLRIHPFEAANGRLARTAARLALRARGLDPDGLTCFEPTLATDPLGYQEEVASTGRRRDAGIWLERWGEAVTAGLRDAARRLDLLAVDVPERARSFLAGLATPAFTVADYRAAAEAGPQTTRTELGQLLDAGLVERVPGSRGLRFVRVAAPGPAEGSGQH